MALEQPDRETRELAEQARQAVTARRDTEVVAGRVMAAVGRRGASVSLVVALTGISRGSVSRWSAPYMDDGEELT